MRTARRGLVLLVLGAVLSACGSAPKKASAPAEAPARVESGAPATGSASSRVSPYAPAQEDLSKRGNYVAGGLYAPGVRDTVPAYIPNVDAIPEPEVRDEPRSRYGNRSPYSVLGRSYSVLERPHGYVERGRASYYGNKFHGRRTSNQEVYDMYAFTAAHRSLPLPSFARVTNLDNGKSVVVRVNDRGPFHSDRLIDLSYAAAVKLGYREHGTANVEVRALTPGEQATLAPRVATAVPVAPAASVSGSPQPVTVAQASGNDYRFDMRQNGKVMTADEFDAWMRSRRVRVATGRPGIPDPVQPVAEATAAPAEPAAVAPVVPTATASQAAPASVAGVQLQVASFASPDNAERALAMLRNAGVPGARLLDATVDGRRIWRLRVGPLAEDAAAPLASRIAGLGFGPPSMVRE